MGRHAADAGAVDGALSARRSQTVHGILGAAMQVINEEGIAGLSMSGLAHRAGVSRQTLYNYFPDIDAVLAGLVQLGSEGGDQLAARLADETDPRAALRAFVEALVGAAAAGHPSRSLLAPALPTELRDAVTDHERQVERLVIDVLERGQRAGVFRADLDAELDGRLWYRAAISASELAAEPDTDVARLTEHLSVDLLRMVLAEGADPASR